MQLFQFRIRQSQSNHAYQTLVGLTQYVKNVTMLEVVHASPGTSAILMKVAGPSVSSILTVQKT